MIETAWQLGGARYEHAEPAPVGHMLGFRGHFLTKSPRLLHHLHRHPRQRRTWRLRTDLDQLAADTDDPGDRAPSTSTPSPSSTTGTSSTSATATTPNANSPWPSPNATAPNDALLGPPGGQHEQGGRSG